ncbi:MAG: hypothetical protein ACXWC9_07045 [Pseudobdellovibrionaceae bacterium]
MFLVLALVGVVWIMQSLRETTPTQMDLPSIPAKIQFERDPPTPPPPK